MNIIEAIHIADTFLLHVKGLREHPRLVQRIVKDDSPTYWRVLYGIEVVRRAVFQLDELDNQGNYVVCVCAKTGYVTNPASRKYD